MPTFPLKYLEKNNKNIDITCLNKFTKLFPWELLLFVLNCVKCMCHIIGFLQTSLKPWCLKSICMCVKDIYQIFVEIPFYKTNFMWHISVHTIIFPVMLFCVFPCNVLLVVYCKFCWLTDWKLSYWKQRLCIVIK